jgi:hypothetical protein
MGKICMHLAAGGALVAKVKKLSVFSKYVNEDIQNKLTYILYDEATLHLKIKL